jgi:putative ABC transport system ATP-binding protein
MSVLELRSISKVYGEGPAEVQALRDVDLSVDAGALVAVMGPSGSGKSTLLTIAGSLEEPTSGQVLVEGAMLSKMSRNDKARLRRQSIGYVFQDFNLLPGLTAAENVSLPLELDGVGARKARAVGLAALDELGLGDQASRFPDSSPAASGSGWPSRARWSGTVGCCSPTNRRVRSTQRTGTP